MNNRQAELIAILRIGHDASIRGAGVSLRDALARSRYKELRSTFGAADLLPLIQDNEALCEQWLAYSRDKRTKGGWYLTEDGEVGRLEPKTSTRFGSTEEAVANYVVHELDFWANVNHAG